MKVCRHLLPCSSLAYIKTCLQQKNSPDMSTVPRASLKPNCLIMAFATAVALEMSDEAPEVMLDE